MLFAVDNGNWRAPVALTTDEPVAHFVSNFRTPPTLLFEPGDYLLTCIIRCDAVKLARINKQAFAVIATLLVAFGFFDNFNHWKVKCCRKCKVALIMRWYTHDSPSTVTPQYIISYPNRYLLACCRISRVTAGKDAGFFFAFAATFDFRFFDSLVDIRFDRLAGIIVYEHTAQGMFRCKHQECCSK